MSNTHFNLNGIRFRVIFCFDWSERPVHNAFPKMSDRMSAITLVILIKISNPVIFKQNIMFQSLNIVLKKTYVSAQVFHHPVLWRAKTMYQYYIESDHALHCSGVDRAQWGGGGGGGGGYIYFPLPPPPPPPQYLRWGGIFEIGMACINYPPIFQV